MKRWKNDDDLFALVRRELFTCVVGDVMDKLELQHQFLPPQIRPLRPDMVVVGRAMPVLAVALEKVRGEKLVRRALEEGGSAVAAFEKHGIM